MPTSIDQRAMRDKRSSAMTRRAFLLTLAAGFTALSDSLVNRLMRACRFDSAPRLSAAG